MRSMLLEGITNLKENDRPLRPADIPVPVPLENEVLIRIHVCGVCHTELDEIEGRTPPPQFPVVPGHQVVGEVVECGARTRLLKKGDRVGVAWIFSACGTCSFCLSGRENLCPSFRATGRDVNGGYAEYMTVPEAFAHPIPGSFSDAEAAPFLCAGAIGYRSLSLSGIKNGDRLGLTGFGASGHLVLKLVRFHFPDSRVHVFARNPAEREHALTLGAVWAGDTTDMAPEKLDAIIDTTPAWKPVVEALSQLRPGGRLIVNAIRKEAGDLGYLQQLDYPSHLWMEKEIKSVANVTRHDVREFLRLAAKAQMKPDYQEFPLEKANQALLELKKGVIRGAKVLRVGG